MERLNCIAVHKPDPTDSFLVCFIVGTGVNVTTLISLYRKVRKYFTHHKVIDPIRLVFIFYTGMVNHKLLAFPNRYPLTSLLYEMAAAKLYPMVGNGPVFKGSEVAAGMPGF